MKLNQVNQENSFLRDPLSLQDWTGRIMLYKLCLVFTSLLENAVRSRPIIRPADSDRHRHARCHELERWRMSCHYRDDRHLDYRKLRSDLFCSFPVIWINLKQALLLTPQLLSFFWEWFDVFLCYKNRGSICFSSHQVLFGGSYQPCLGDSFM